MSGADFELAGRTAVVTGGGGVLGGAMASGLAAAGVRVAVLGRTEATLQRRVEAIHRHGGEGIALVADVLDRAALVRAREVLVEAWGGIDILVNAAGGNMPGATITPEQSFFDLSIDDFDAVVDLNLKGTVLPTFVFGAPMSDQRRGVIVNISSMAAVRPLTRVVGYSVAKTAIDSLTRWLAVEMARKFGPGIRVNAIAPGFFLGEQNRRLLVNEDGTPTARGAAALQGTPMGRFGEPDELVGALHWLCSDAAAFVTGIVVPVDGGFSAFGGV